MLHWAAGRKLFRAFHYPPIAHAWLVVVAACLILTRTLQHLHNNFGNFLKRESYRGGAPGGLLLDLFPPPPTSTLLEIIIPFSLCRLYFYPHLDMQMRKGSDGGMDYTQRRTAEDEDGLITPFRFPFEIH